MKVDLAGKVALVTGAGAGIGRAIALAMAANGASVLVNDLEGRGDQTAAEVSQLGCPSRFIAADVSKRGEVDRMIAAAEREFGGIDILVNNAGVNTPGERRRPIHEYDGAEWRRVLGVDLDGLFHCCRATTPGMVARKSGTVINISSVLGVIPIRLQSAFAAAKAAVINFSRSIALELAPFGIRVNAIAPGSVLTQETSALFYNPEKRRLAEDLLSHIPLGRPGTPEEIASAALFLASPDSAYITGTVLIVDGGWTAGFAREW
jgi:3-oxoacyl-[acyl-carrier protein] reductase